jgi:hypothetical protein
MSKAEEYITDSTKSQIAYCAAHTMKRWTKSLDKLQMSKSQKRFSSFLFSLLLNSKTLQEISIFFEHICVVMLSPTKTKYYYDSERLLAQSLANRPDCHEIVQSFVNRAKYTDSKVGNGSGESIDTSVFEFVKQKPQKSTSSERWW